MNITLYENKYWEKGIKYVAGIDEAGRGPLAGPVVASCIIFDKNTIIEGIKDSKKISPKKRLLLYPEILKKSLSYGIGVVHEDEIDNLNILQATYLAMRKSIGNLTINPEQIIVDGPMTDIKQYDVECIINGDSKSHTIGAASIIAKVYRDRIMDNYDKLFPEYDFINNKGYGTKKHISSINEYKASPIHRQSFNIVNLNIPNYKFVYDNYGFDKLACQIVGVKYIKNNYDILECLFNEKESTFDLLTFKDNNLTFIKVYNVSNKNKYKDSEKAYFIKEIKKYMLQKDMNSTFSFNVNFVEFIKNNKPKIETIEIV